MRKRDIDRERRGAVKLMGRFWRVMRSDELHCVSIICINQQVHLVNQLYEKGWSKKKPDRSTKKLIHRRLSENCEL